MPKFKTARARLILVAGLVLTLAVILGVILTRSSKTPEVTAMNPEEMTEQSPWFNYRCNDGSQVAARYSQTADSSISFVDLKLEGQHYRLDQQVSASGTRYSDAQRQWWTKGQMALFTREPASQAKQATEPATEAASAPQLKTPQATDPIIEGAAVECQQSTGTQ